jgi:large subunit ribosomal protein L23
MELTRVIVGSPVTEKTERLKAIRCYTVEVDPAATKVDIARALETYFGVKPVSVRVMRVRPKARALGAGKIFTRRHRSKKAVVTLAPDSKPLDLAQFNAS